MKLKHAFQYLSRVRVSLKVSTLCSTLQICYSNNKGTASAAESLVFNLKDPNLKDPLYIAKKMKLAAEELKMKQQMRDVEKDKEKDSLKSNSRRNMSMAVQNLIYSKDGFNTVYNEGTW
jgi:hypothetical protein